MGKLGRRALVLLVAALSMLVIAACGGDDDSGGSTGSSSGGTKEGGSVTISQTSQPDYLDPALSYTVNGWEPLSTVYSGLLGYKRAEGQEGSELIPVLATDMPKVSSDGTTYELTLRKGLKYSDGTPVKASDFPKTIERDYAVNSPGVGFFGNIVGADEFSKTKTGHIST